MYTAESLWELKRINSAQKSDSYLTRSLARRYGVIAIILITAFIICLIPIMCIIAIISIITHYFFVGWLKSVGSQVV